MSSAPTCALLARSTARSVAEGEGQTRALRKEETFQALRQQVAAHHKSSSGRPPLATGTALDELLQGGLPRGKLIELFGEAGKQALTLSTMAHLTQQGELLAFIDPEDALDLKTATHLGVDFSRVLWVRPRGDTAAQRLTDAMKALDLLLSSAGFALVILYSASPRLRALPARPLWSPPPASQWARIVQRAEHSNTAVLIASSQAQSGSAAAATLRCTAGAAHWAPAPGSRSLLHKQATDIEVLRSRLSAPGETASVDLHAMRAAR